MHPNLNIKLLYKEYSIICKFKKSKTLSEWKFRHIFNTKFNLEFHPKRVDTKRTLYTKRTSLAMVKHSKEIFNQTIEDAQNDPRNVGVLVFDLQRALEIPSISTSEACYRRLIWCYNLCVYDEKRKKGYHYFWNESISSLGFQEISSCLKKHFENFVPKDAEKIILYSDACGGQNRNMRTTLMIKKMLSSWPYDQLESIKQRFFVSRHSYNSCDRCFGIIEKQKRNTEMISTILDEHHKPSEKK